MLLLLLCEYKSQAKHVNTYSYHFWVVTLVRLMAIIHCYMDSGHLYKLNGVKKFVLCALEVDIINVHVFTRQPG